MSWDAIVSDYLAVLGRRGRSAGTIRAYRFALHDFERFLTRESLDIASAEPSDVEHWQDDQIRRGLSARSRQLSASAVRSALRWAAQRGACDPSLSRAVETPRAPRLLPRPLSTADVERIRAYLHPRRPRANLMYWRTRALFFYAVTTGARISEILSVDREDLALEAVVVTQKGGSEKALFAPPVAMEAVADYLRHRCDAHPALFVSHGNPPTRRLTAIGAREAWHQLADQLRIERFTTHQLRHTCATELLEAGVPAEVVAAHLGHHGLGSLTGYGEVRRGRRQLAVEAMETRLGRNVMAPGQRFVAVKGGKGRRVELS